MLASFLSSWFGFPNGSVLTNLIASIVWASPVVITLWRKLHKIHEAHKRLHEHLGIDEDV